MHIHIYVYTLRYIHIYIHISIHTYTILRGNLKNSANAWAQNRLKIFEKRNPGIEQMFNAWEIPNSGKCVRLGKCKKAQGNTIPHALHYTIFCPQSQPSISRSIHSIASSTLHVSPILVPLGR